MDGVAFFCKWGSLLIFRTDAGNAEAVFCSGFILGYEVYVFELFQKTYYNNKGEES